MFSGIKKLFMDVLTEDDNNSVFCPVRIIGVTGAGSLFGLSGYMAFMHGTFDATAFGTAVAAIAGAVGVGAGVKAKMGA